MEKNLFAEERKHQIVEYINKNSKASVVELCKVFKVSPATVRNDLNELNELGLISRTHGGAISTASVNYELPTNEKMLKGQDKKVAIAAKALEFINEGDSIGLDAGTTSFEIAKQLTKFKNLTVVTYDLSIASFLDINTSLRIIIAGGEVRSNFHYTTGDRAIQSLKDLNLDISLMATNGISIRKGITTPNLDTAQIKRIMMNNSKKTILITDSSKINNISFTKFADIEDIDILITDDCVPDEFVQGLKDYGVKLVIAETTSEDETIESEN